VLCGYRAGELLLARLMILFCVVVLVGTGLALLLPAFFAPQRLAFVLLGFLLCGLVYGGLGLLVGALFRRELEGVLLIALIANVDVGWLQNPIYYAQAESKALIHALPGFFPAQLAMAAAFSEHLPGELLRLAARAGLYGLTLVLAALAVYAWRTRVFSHQVPSAASEEK
jgi:hypothetical protein